MKKICQALIAFCGSDACVESYLSRLLEFIVIGVELGSRRPRIVARHRIAGPSLVHDQIIILCIHQPHLPLGGGTVCRLPIQSQLL